MAIRANLSQRILLLGLLAGLLVTWKLWLTDRAFPHLTVWPWFGPLPAPWDSLLLGATLASLIPAFVFPRRRLPLALLLGLCLWLALQDQVRWQPWFYFYWLALTGFLLFPASSSQRGGGEAIVLLRLLLVAMYFWSGFHKLHPAYATLHQTAFVEPLAAIWPDPSIRLLSASDRFVPWIEISVAFLLLQPIALLRVGGVGLAIATHAFILLLVGPLGLSNNHVIWPWNLALAALTPVAFWNLPGIPWPSLAAFPVRFASIPLALLVGVLPAFSPGHWDRYFSFHLYSGRDQRIMLVMDDAALGSLPPAVRPFVRPAGDGHLHELRFKEWAFHELRAPLPCEERHLLRLAKQFATLPFPPHSLAFFYYDYEFELKTRGWDRFTPHQILHLNTLPDPTQPYPGN
ncbi:MAG: hypothetical protein ACKV19_07300 [Verrucomicrobiales bacterium]